MSAETERMRDVREYVMPDITGRIEDALRRAYAAGVEDWAPAAREAGYRDGYADGRAAAWAGERPEDD